MTTTSNSAVRDPHDLNLVAAYVEHRLDNEERSQFERHLVTCTECRELLATYARASMADGRADNAPARRFPIGVSGPWLALAASAVLATGVSLYLGLRPGRGGPSTDPRQPPPAVQRPGGPATVPAPAVVTPAPVPAVAAPPSQESLSKTRSSDRHVGGKTFRLEAGAWVDTVYDPLQLLPTTEVTSSEQQMALVEQRPELKPYMDLGPHVIVVVDGTVYRLDVK